jgi:NADH-quinone oxidoreductase subunit J
MPWDVIIFYLISAVCVLSAVGVVVANNPVHSAIFLVLCFFNVAAVFVMLGAEFLAVAQIIVYTGAILVLVLFVLMLVDPDDLPEFHAARPVQRYVGLLLGAILLLEMGVAILDRTVVGRTAVPSQQEFNQLVSLAGGNTQALGRTLYTQYLLPFEVISLVLTVGVIGAIVLALPERLGERIFRRGTISLGHPRGTDLALPAGVVEEAPISGAGNVEVIPGGYGRRIIMVRDPNEQPVIGRR